MFVKAIEFSLRPRENRFLRLRLRVQIPGSTLRPGVRARGCKRSAGNDAVLLNFSLQLWAATSCGSVRSWISRLQPADYNLIIRSIARRHTVQKWLVRVNMMQSISGR